MAPHVEGFFKVIWWCCKGSHRQVCAGRMEKALPFRKRRESEVRGSCGDKGVQKGPEPSQTIITFIGITYLFVLILKVQKKKNLS